MEGIIVIEVNISKASKHFGTRELFKELDFKISTNERVALIGSNGSGKSTLLKIIAGLETLDEGEMALRKGITIGYLPQIPPQVDQEVLVREILMNAFLPLQQIEEKMNHIATLLASETDSKRLEKLCNQYCDLEQSYHEAGGYEKETLFSKVCAGFKIREEMLDRKFQTLSGGEKTIIYLASLILKKPSLLLLDEATNHLDMETLEWFENYLKSYDGTMIIISHDRYFLDQVATKTMLLSGSKIDVFFGNYSYFQQENEKRIMIEFEKYKDQQKMIEAMKNKIKKLQEFGKLAVPYGESFFKRAASIQKRLDRIEVLAKPEEKKELPLQFTVAHRSGKEVLKIEDLYLSIGNKSLLKKASLLVRYGEHVALIGKNGTGKSTLVKEILATYRKSSSEHSSIHLGSQVVVGYLPQEIYFADENKTVLETVRENFQGSEPVLRATLAKFLFFDDAIYKRVGTLSGGEKVRLKLLELIKEQANFLILDEVTNHIDIDTREMLEEALKEFTGTILFVSHDRYFINKLADRVVAIENNKLNSYLGNYEDYKRKYHEK